MTFSDVFCIFLAQENGSVCILATYNKVCSKKRTPHTDQSPCSTAAEQRLELQKGSYLASLGCIEAGASMARGRFTGHSKQYVGFVWFLFTGTAHYYPVRACAAGVECLVCQFVCLFVCPPLFGPFRRSQPLQGLIYISEDGSCE